MSKAPEPVITAYRDNLPYRCALTYWGRQWIINRKPPFLHRCHVWTAHSPVDGPEQIKWDGRNCPGAHLVTAYNLSGRAIYPDFDSERPSD
jgi:hypothetical protein